MRRKENEKDVKKTYNKQLHNVIFLFGLKMTEWNITYIYIYIH